MFLVGAVRRVERQKVLFAVRTDAVADNVRDGIDFEIERPGPVRYDVVLVRAVADVDAIGALGEQIERRCAVQRQIRSIDDALEGRLAAAQQNHELELVRIDAFQSPREPVTSKNRYRCGKRKILLQQPVSLKRAQGHRQQRLVVAEADRLDRAGRNELVPPRCASSTAAPARQGRSPGRAHAACSPRRRGRSDRNRAARSPSARI